jgi:hypothetical protein
MQRRVPPGENEFEQLIHALPADWEAMMRDLGAFTYAGKIQSPEELLRALFLYGGPDQSLREVAGTLTLYAERITDQAVWKRLQRCAPFLKALVKRMLPLDDLPAVPQPLRFLACDGTTVQRPGATTSDYRLHLVINLVTLGLHDVQVTETKTGESLRQYQLQAGDVMVGDQGYCSYVGILHTVYQQHADVLVRWNHQRALYDPSAPERVLDFLSLSRLNHRLPRGQAHPEVVEGAAEFHHEITDARLPQADAVFDNATALHAAVDMLDPQPPLVERLVGQVLLQGQLPTAWLFRRHQDRHLRERERQEAQIL